MVTTNEIKEKRLEIGDLKDHELIFYGHIAEGMIEEIEKEIEKHDEEGYLEGYNSCLNKKQLLLLVKNEIDNIQ